MSRPVHRRRRGPTTAHCGNCGASRSFKGRKGRERAERWLKLPCFETEAERKNRRRRSIALRASIIVCAWWISFWAWAVFVWHVG